MSKPLQPPVSTVSRRYDTPELGSRRQGATMPTPPLEQLEGKQLLDGKCSTDSLELDIRRLGLAAQLPETARLLGLSPDFLEGLLDEPSDWAFVIKLAVVVEAALTQTIASHFDTPAMQQHLNRLPIDGRIGKIQLARDLQLLDSITQERLRAIASTRNVFAHDVSVIQLSLEKYIDGLDTKAGQKLFAKLLATKSPKAMPEVDSFPGSAARYVFWTSACIALRELSGAFCNNENASRWRDARVLLGEAFLARMQGQEPEAREKLAEARSTLTAVVSSPASPRVCGG